MTKAFAPFALAGLIAMAAPAAAADLPTWAYPLNPPNAAQPKDDGSLKHVPGSNAALTQTQILGRFNVPDWHPDDHPAMPEIVAKGKQPAVVACGYCHQPNGAGRPENASLLGLTADYIKQQVIDFRNGVRPGSEPKRVPQNLMINVAKNVSDADVEIAAAYFASLKRQTFVKVIESETAPKTFVTGGMLAMVDKGGTEPLGGRLIEVPNDVEQAENRDPRTPFTAYVPVGSINKGLDLVATGAGGKTIPCTICHGQDLKGLGNVPPLAGRSPSYVIRQLYDIQQGKRSGAGSALMKQVVDKLGQDDMVAIAAFLASREP